MPIFNQYGFDLISLNQLNLKDEPPIEDGDNVIENALIKARHYHSKEHPWVFADDMSVEIDALNGEPGVQTRRWGGRFPDDVDNQVWLDYLLERMKGVPSLKRTASFVDGWAIVTPDRSEYTWEIRQPFQIATERIRPALPGSAVVAVALGYPDDPAQIQIEARKRWRDWGILEKLAKIN